MKSQSRNCVVFVLLWVPVVAAAKPTLNDYVGKWDLVLANTGSSFSACCVEVRRAEPNPEAELVWRWGSVHRKVKVEVDGDGNLLLHNKGLWRDPLRLRRVGDSLEGESTERNGKKFTVFGSRSRSSVNAAGVWDVSVETPEGETDTGTLTIWSIGAGRIAASAVNSAGDSIQINRAALEGNRLQIRFSTEDGQQLELNVELRGDRLIGTIKTEEAEDSPMKVAGKRRRKFGPAVKLIAANGTGGWHARDTSRPFRWTCTSGVLTNGNRDVDIVSDAQFGDFKLTLEYKVDKPGANSGVYLRGRYEVQIVGNNRLSDHSNGAVYSRIRPRSNPFSGVGKWQTVEIVLIDRYVTVKMNDTVVIDNQRLHGITGGALRSLEHEPGPLMLQGDHGKIYYRNVEVHPALP